MSMKAGTLPFVFMIVCPKVKYILERLKKYVLNEVMIVFLNSSAA